MSCSNDPPQLFSLKNLILVWLIKFNKKNVIFETSFNFLNVPYKPKQTQKKGETYYSGEQEVLFTNDKKLKLKNEGKLIDKD